MKYFTQHAGDDKVYRQYNPISTEIWKICQRIHSKNETYFFFKDVPSNKVVLRYTCTIEMLEQIIDLELERKYWEDDIFHFIYHNVDYHRTGREYWKGIYDLLKQCTFTSLNNYTKRDFKECWKIIDKERYVQRGIKIRSGYLSLTYQQRYGKKVGDWIDSVFNKWQLDRDCMDNERVALMSNNRDRKYYKYLYQQGCCGFTDEILVCPHDNQKYKLGCNYGH